MKGIGAVAGAFLAGLVAGTVYLYASGSLSQPEAAPVVAAAPADAALPLPPEPPDAGAPDAEPPDAGPEDAAQAEPADAGEPDAAAVPEDAGAPASDKTPTLTKAPPAPFGRLVVASIGGKPVSVDLSGQRQRGTKVTFALAKPTGKLSLKSPDGVFDIDIRFKADGGDLAASIDCSPMALIGAGGQVATHLETRVGRGPLKVDFNGGAAGSYSLILQHVK